MSELVEASTQFPTIIFTVALGIALLYWVFVLLGALDIDLLGGGEHIGDAITGGAKGGAEALKGAHADGFLGLDRVPLTISVSFVVLVGWCASLLGMYYLGDAGWIGALVLVGSLAVALPLTAVAVRPLAPVFAIKEGKSNRDYVGHICTITTGHVDDGFGQATIEDGGTVLVIAVRCDRKDALKRGDKALIVDFDTARHAYIVEPAGELVDLPVA